MKNKLQDLRNHLFAELERLGDPGTKPEDLQLDRSRAICDVSKQIVDSAKLEVDFYRTVGKLKVDGAIDRGALPSGGFFETAPKLLGNC